MMQERTTGKLVCKSTTGSWAINGPYSYTYSYTLICHVIFINTVSQYNKPGRRAVKSD